MEWVGANKEWFFSGLGVTILLALVWIFRAGFARLWSTPEIIVKVEGAIVRDPWGNLIDALSIRAENHSGKDMVIGNFMLLTKTNRIYVPTDQITGRPQGRQTIRAGDSASFYILASEFRQSGYKAEDFVGAAVETPLNKEFRSTGKGIQGLVAAFLKDGSSPASAQA